MEYIDCKIATLFWKFWQLSDIYRFAGTMSVSKRSLFLIWHNEAVASRKLLAVETHIFNSVIDKTKYDDDQCREIRTKLRMFVVKLVEKWKNCSRCLGFFEKKYKEWLDGDLELITPNISKKVG